MGPVHINVHTLALLYESNVRQKIRHVVISMQSLAFNKVDVGGGCNQISLQVSARVLKFQGNADVWCSAANPAEWRIVIRPLYSDWHLNICSHIFTCEYFYIYQRVKPTVMWSTNLASFIFIFNQSYV